MGISTFPSTSGGFIKKRQLFRTSGTFTLPGGYGASKPLLCEMTMVGGGGAGGGFSGSAHSAGGGGGGRVIRANFYLTDNIPIVIGAGGVYSSGTWGAKGGDTLVGVATEGNLIPNPFFYTGVAYSNTGYTFSTLTGSTGTNAANTTRTDRPYITDAQHPLGRHQIQSQGIRVSNGASVTQYRMETTNFFNVTPSTLYYFGAYTATSTSANTISIVIDWYTSANALISSSTALSYTTTTLAKYKSSATAPANAAKAKMRFDFNMNTTSVTIDIYAVYCSKNYDYAPYEDTNVAAYWTGTPYTSTINVLEAGGLGQNWLNTLPNGNTTGFIIGGGGGGGRAGDAYTAAQMKLIRGGQGAGWGGWASNETDVTSGRCWLGGDGGGAGGPAYNDSYLYSVSQTAGQNFQNFGEIDSTQAFNRMPMFNNITKPLDYSSRYGSFPFRPNQNADGTYRYYIDRKPGPDIDGFGHGGPGSGWWTPNTQTMWNRYDASKQSRFGNGGAASPNAITVNYIDWYTYAGWDRDGDPGLVRIEWEEEA